MSGHGSTRCPGHEVKPIPLRERRDARVALRSARTGCRCTGAGRRRTAGRRTSADRRCVPARSARDRTRPGPSQNAGSRCRTYGMTNASHPRGRRNPPSSSSASACREKPHAGGYRRMRFVDHHARIRQIREIGVLGRPSVEHGVDLLLEPPLRVRVLRQQIPGPRQRQRRRLLARQQKRRDLDPQLLVGHRLAGLLVARRHQHRQQIGAVRRTLRRRSADDVIDGAAQHGPRRLEPPVPRRRQPVGEPERPEALADVLIDDRPGLVDLSPRTGRGRRRAAHGARRCA